MKARKKTNNGKYTIGPHGEIYNNQPELSERSKNLLNAMIFQDALEEAFSELKEEEEEKKDDDQGTPEAGDQSICD